MKSENSAIEVDGFNAFLQKTFGILALTIVIALGFSFATFYTPALLSLSTSMVFQIGALITMITIIFICNPHTKPNTAWFCLMLFAALSGITLTPYALLYSADQILLAMLAACSTFAGSAAYGYFTKRNLLGLGNILFSVLIAIIIVSFVNAFFVQSSMMSMLISLIIIPLVVIITAFDMQMFREMYQRQIGHSEESLAVTAALCFFINLKLLFQAFLGLGGND